MNSVFEYLKEFEIVNKKGVNVLLIDSLSNREIFKIVDLLLHLTETKSPHIAQKHFYPFSVTIAHWPRELHLSTAQVIAARPARHTRAHSFP